MHNNGPADYTDNSPTSMWIKQKVTEIFRKMINNKEKQLAEKTSVSPQHIPHSNNQAEDFSIDQKVTMVTPKWTKRSLLGIQHLTGDEITYPLDISHEYRKAKINGNSPSGSLGKTIVNLFLEPSTRTRVVFELAAKRLQADVITIAEKNPQPN